MKKILKIFNILIFYQKDSFAWSVEDLKIPCSITKQVINIISGSFPIRSLPYRTSKTENDLIKKE